MLALSFYRFTFSTDENFYPKEASADTLRRFVFLDCMEAMAECRRQDRYNHRSMYRRARGLLVKNFYLGLRGGEEDVTSRTEEAKECMFLLFDKKRPQVVGAWMPEERKDSFEAINQVSPISSRSAVCEHARENCLGIQGVF